MVSGIFLVVFVVMLGINNMNNGGFVSVWHILVLLVVERLFIPFWPVNYVLVVAGASLIAYLQNRVVDYSSKKKLVGEKVLGVFRG